MTIYEFAVTFYDLRPGRFRVAFIYQDRAAGKPDNRREDSVFSKKHESCAALILAGAGLLMTAGTAVAAWQPTQPIEFVATAGAGGGTDIIARTIQTIITKHKLLSQPVSVVNKAGGSGLEGYLYGKQFAGNPHKIIVG